MKPTDDAKAFFKGLRDSVLAIGILLGALYASDHYSLQAADLPAATTSSVASGR